MTDTDWLALADFLDAHANDMRSWTEDEPKFRAAADGLRQYAAITTADKNWRTLKALYDEHLRVVRAERDEARDQYAAITAAIGPPMRVMDLMARGTTMDAEGDELAELLSRIYAAAVSPPPAPTTCPECGSDDPGWLADCPVNAVNPWHYRLAT
jgi:hypothetical protein